MGNRVQALAQLIMGKASLEECSVEEIKHLVQRYPYFAPAQFLLLQKLIDGADPQAEAQHRKAVLYYSDPLQFSHFISSDFFQKDEAVSIPPDDEAAIQNVEVPVEPEAVHETAVSAVDASGTEETLMLPAAGTEGQISAVDSTGVLATKEVDPEGLPVPEDLTVTEETIAEEPVDAVTSQYENIKAPEGQNAPDAVRNDHAAKRLLTAPIETGASAEIAFEPYHTVDYFASQGIKPVADELPKDKLGKGLKSFTEWLRTMKRLPSAETPAPEAASEKTIQTMANSSVSNMEIVTEAMAEVWARQGNREKAIETYHKLSLLYPPKKAFFAGKIENLKTS